MNEDIVDRLTAWVEHEAREPDPARAILDARDAIVAARKALMNLSAAVVGSDTLEEARSIAWKLAPLDDRAVILQGFHEVEAAWRPTTAEGFKAKVLPTENKPASEPTHPSALHAMTFSQPWIPVGERLPESDDPVLVSWGGCMVGIAWITKKGNWRDIEGKFPRTVDHWMPLPEPPEGQP